jgi:hypothetical protein
MTTFYSPIPVAAAIFTSDTYINGSVPASFDAFLTQSTAALSQNLHTTPPSETFEQEKYS